MDPNTAFDTAEALNVLAHDYGLYAVKTELDRIGFKAGVNRDTFDGLDSAGKEIYWAYEAAADEADPYAVPDWAAELIQKIETVEWD